MPLSTPTFAPQAPSGMHMSRGPKPPSPPKFSGANKDKLTLDQWVDQFMLYVSFWNLTDDHNLITLALNYLEGGALQYMHSFQERIVQRQDLGTWDEFYQTLASGYRDLSPDRAAQKKLDELDKKQFSSLVAFAEKFRLWAPQSKYSDVDLIQRIESKYSKDLRGILIARHELRSVNGSTKWQNVLDNALQVEAEMRNVRTSSTAPNTTLAAPAKPAPSANDMDVDAINQSHEDGKPLNEEQLAWFKDKKCFRCGRHVYVRDERCRHPKYRGWFQLPTSKSSNSSTHSAIRVVNSETASSVADSAPAVAPELIAIINSAVGRAISQYSGQTTSSPPSEQDASRVVEEQPPDFPHQQL